MLAFKECYFSFTMYLFCNISLLTTEKNTPKADFIKKFKKLQQKICEGGVKDKIKYVESRFNNG